MFHFSAQQTGAPGKPHLCSQTIIQALLYREFQIDTVVTDHAPVSIWRSIRVGLTP